MRDDEWRKFWREFREKFPALTVITGTGISFNVPNFKTVFEIRYADIPHFPRTELAGHEKILKILSDGENEIAVMAGRYHLYEVGDPYLAAITSHFACALGTELLIQISAVGSISSNIRPADLVLFTDYVNFTGTNPLAPPHTPFAAPRFVPMYPSFSPKVNEIFISAASEAGVFLKRGVYAFVHGPMFETAAEIEFFRRAGTDVVGMSTVPEVVIARSFGVETAGIGVVTNRAPAAWGEENHEKIVAAAQKAGENLNKLFEKAIGRLMNGATSIRSET